MFALYLAQSLWMTQRGVRWGGYIGACGTAREDGAALIERRDRHAVGQTIHGCPGLYIYLGLGILCPFALERALKLKEISYIHAEGCAAGKMKDGRIAVIDERLPVVALMQNGQLYEKLLSNVQEVKARGGVLALVEEGEMSGGAVEELDRLIVPKSQEWLALVLFNIPLNCWPIRSRCFGGRMWISPGISQRVSRWSWQGRPLCDCEATHTAPSLSLIQVFLLTRIITVY